MTTIAVMQPYFFPYAGYFRLLAVADLFVIYDCVQFPRRGWVHRNRLPGHDGKARWLTLPLIKAPQAARIDAIRVAADAPARLAAELPRFPLVAAAERGHPLICALLAPGGGALVDYLESGLRAAAQALGLTTPMVRSSAFGIDPAVTGQSRILAIAESVGADCYVNAPGGRALYDAELFRARGIALRFLDAYPGPAWSILARALAEPPERLAGEIHAAL